MYRVFLDANIIIDLIDSSRNNAKESQKAIRYLIENNITIYTSCDILTTVYYINSKKFDNFKLINIIKKLLTIIEIIPITKEISLKALEYINDSNLDFEDTLQYFGALEYNCEMIITNDKKFIKDKIEVLSVAEFNSKFYSILEH